MVDNLQWSSLSTLLDLVRKWRRPNMHEVLLRACEYDIFADMPVRREVVTLASMLKWFWPNLECNVNQGYSNIGTKMFANSRY